MNRTLAVPLLCLLALTASRCTASRPSPEASPLRVVVISDLNSAYGSTTYEPRVSRTIDRIREVWRPDLVLAAGDMIAGQQPSLSDQRVEAMWEAFDAVVGAPLRDAGIPFAPTIGNHDGSRYPAHARDRELAERHWRHPRHRPALRFIDSADFPFNYSFVHEGLFVLVWDASNEEIARSDDQLRWVEQALSSPQARGAGMRIVLGHLPLYAVAEGRNRPGEVLAQPDSLRSLLERHRVHTYVSGHHHAYYPGRRGQLELLHTGALGQGPRPLIGSNEEPFPSVTLLEIWPARDSASWTTYRISEDGTQIEHVADTRLPTRIDGFNGHVVRRDLR
ncbi:metallophosphoesterase [soil metagenome]